MIKTNHPIQNLLSLILFPMIFMIMFPSMTIAQDREQDSSRNLVVSANVLTIADNSTSTPSDSLPGNNTNTFQSTTLDMDVEKSEKGDLMATLGKTANQMSQYFLKYIKVEDTSADNPTQYLLKSKVDTLKMNPNNFEVNLYLQVEYDSKKDLKMDAIKIESYWHNTFVNATYNYEKNEVDLGLSRATINEYLFEGMKLEFHTNPSTGSGALLLSTSF